MRKGGEKMCLAKAYLSEDGEKELILEEVAFLKIEGGKLHLWTLFGEQKEIEANIKEVDFQNSHLILENPT
jgi:predicted RNA-binding protein